MSLHHGLRATAGASPADPYFSSTSLLLLGNGTNGGQNNTFVDSSTNNFTITRNGNTTQGSFSPFSAPDGRWSNYFDGSGDELNCGSNSAFSFGSGAYTVEFWVWMNVAIGASHQPCFVYNDTTGGWGIYNADGAGNLQIASRGSAFTLTSATNLTANQWNHVVAVRSGTGTNQTSIFVNGSRVANGTDSQNWTVTGPLKIGGITLANYYLNGSLSSVRVVKGTAVYDPTLSTLTVPTAPLSAITNTSLLTCQSNRFLDNSSNAFTITPYGNAAVTNFAPFATGSEYSTGTNGGSGYFDGSGDYLSIGSASQAEFNFGSPSGSTNNFTIEGWFYSTGSLNSSNNQLLVGVHDNATCGSWGVYVRSDGVFIFGSGCTFTGGGTIRSNTWYHFAIVRSGSTLTVYVNGQQVDQQTRTGDYENSGDTLGVGRQVANGNYAFTGYISNLRILKGTAQYTANFTPPTSPLTAITNTSLLLNFTNASIIDSTGKNDLETVGDAQISTSVKKFGTGSIYFDGTGDYLYSAANQNTAFGTGDFTIEYWVYGLSSAARQDWFDLYNGTVANRIQILWVSSQVAYYQNNTFVTGGGTYAANTWYHIALTRSSGSNRLFLNGTQVGTTATNTTNFSANSFYLGISNGGGTAFNGYIDDLRITKGVARYTAAFTPPAAQLPSR